MKNNFYFILLKKHKKISGSTWAQELIWLLCNNLDFEGAKKPQFIRSPLLELSALFAINHNEWLKYVSISEYISPNLLNAHGKIFILSKSIGNSVEFVDNLPSPRFIKTHLPLELLPKEMDIVKPKVSQFKSNRYIPY